MLETVSIIIPVAKGETSYHVLLDDLKNTNAEIIISSENTRTASLNIGAQKASKEYLWFLHADSRLKDTALSALQTEIANKSDAIHYFDLAYEESGLAKLNAYGANLRSRLFGWPYGDQGFCLSKVTFKKLGGYPDAQYGEDLLLVRKAKREKIRLKRIPAKLLTSARKYHDYGWLKLSLQRQIQLIKLLRMPL